MKLPQSFTRSGRVLLAGCLVGFMTGCAHQYTPERSFGLSVRDHLALQTKAPGGIGHNRVTGGFEGAAARSTVDNYLRGFEQPKPTQDVLKLGVGVK
jgi:hypothetical protein